ncbi:iron response transcriptional regulator IrrA [Phreatobacter sp. AB_2022a]|uniref:iron response transcriptional regulator IrrA n=1 Tax=Phreatobacter sp. AB_2022a TaxID=3003134 RepID=UPI002286F311|nr:transcriptional repressor [Phreatobacter sp. AB_2022a]MCZ0737666.1 transcriptional repressor [Phreatobacter sp. AB_2022a]
MHAPLTPAERARLQSPLRLGDPPAQAGAGIAGRLRAAGLRPTRQRCALAILLFSGRPRHVTASGLAGEAAASGVRLSLATVYNTLNQFTAAGLLARLGIGGELAVFDTDPAHHHHFHLHEEGRLIDVPAAAIGFGRLPAPPAGYAVARIDVVIRLRRIA